MIRILAERIRELVEKLLGRGKEAMAPAAKAETASPSL
jgi:hypothetical protein